MQEPRTLIIIVACVALIAGVVWFRMRMAGPPATGGSLLLLLLVAIAVAAAISGTARGAALAAGCVALIAGVAWMRRASRPRMKVAVSAGGFGWIHPARGSGMLPWKDIGALILNEGERAGGTSVCLVPRGEPAGVGCVISTEDLGVGPEKGEEMLRAFVERILPMLPADVTVDRGMRRKLAEWGLERGLKG
jgi:hypothetical protein